MASSSIFASSLHSLGISEFCFSIQQHEHEFPETVVDALHDNGIDGSLFLQLSTEELKELAPRIADRVALRQIQSMVRGVFFLVELLDS